jgi:hypothetical protein
MRAIASIRKRNQSLSSVRATPGGKGCLESCHQFTETLRSRVVEVTYSAKQLRVLSNSRVVGMIPEFAGIAAKDFRCGLQSLPGRTGLPGKRAIRQPRVAHQPRGRQI